MNTESLIHRLGFLTPATANDFVPIIILTGYIYYYIPMIWATNLVRWNFSFPEIVVTVLLR